MAVIDYFSGTVQTRSVQEVMEYVGRFFPSWVQGKGAHGYSESWSAPGFRVFHGGQAGMGVYFQASGEGCATIEASSGFSTWGDFALEFREFGWKCSRIDMAFDDREGVLNVPELTRKCIAGECTTKYRKVKPVSGYLEGVPDEETLYLGTAQSDTSCCIYNKRLERIARGEVDPGHWVRVELRYKHKAADGMLSWLIENPDMEGADGFLSSSIEFRELSEDTNKARWPISSFWSDFRNNSAKLCVHSIKVVRTVEQHVKRFTMQHSATLCMLVLCMCGGAFRGKWLDDLLITGWGRMNLEQVAVVRKHLGPDGLLGLLPLNKGIRRIE